jgi:SAM-dependent methyltransferase
VLAAALVLGAAAQTTEPRTLPEVPYVPTSPEAVKAMLQLANVKPDDVVYDLGCGDGRIVIAAAKDFGARAVGVDIDPQRVTEARENATKAGIQDRVRFEEKDLFQADIHDATVVTLFLLTDVNLRLRPKLLKELKPGTRVVSNTFGMGDWKPEKEVKVGNEADAGFLSHRLYLWTIPQPAK